MVNKVYKVYLKDGKIPATLYPSFDDAVKAHGLKNIAKVDEVIIKKGNSSSVAQSKDLILVLSSRSDEDLKLSLKCGYAVTYNSPSFKKIFQGMKYLEVSENLVLEGTIVKLDKYDSKLHHDWNSIIPRKQKPWNWAIYHTNSSIIPREEAEGNYGKISGVQGGIGYIDLTKKK
jgi:hypothetical protein